MPEGFDDRLKPGARYRCPRCRQEHVIERPHADATTAARFFLYVWCRGQQYFVGQQLDETA